MSVVTESKVEKIILIGILVSALSLVYIHFWSTDNGASEFMTIVIILFYRGLLIGTSYFPFKHMVSLVDSYVTENSFSLSTYQSFECQFCHNTLDFEGDYCSFCGHPV